MASDVRILPSAQEELENIVAYLAAHGREAAKKFLSDWKEHLALLGSGTVEYALSHLPELAKLGYRAFRVESYVVLYYRDGQDAVIAHIFHHRQDYARLVIE